MKYKLIVWLFLFCVSSTGAILVNKYVLWKLKFTYPTIFQSWQMVFAAFLLFSFHVLGHLEAQKLSYDTLKMWIPAITLFSVSIYSGSVSLARLPIPIFCFVQQAVIHCFAQLRAIQQSNNISNQSNLALLTSISCLIMTLLLDKIHLKGKRYKWLLLHCTSNCIYAYYAVTYNSIKLKEHDKLMLNSLISIFMLMSFGIYTGEARIVFEFPFLYHQVFLLACTLSGIFCAMFMISYVKLCEELSLETVRCYNTIFICIVTFLSFFVFGDGKLAQVQILVICIGLSSTLYLAFCISKGKKLQSDILQKADNTIV